MKRHEMTRREVLQQGGMAITGLALLNSSRMNQAAPLQQGETVLPWLDQLPENPVPEVLANQLDWEQLDSWITPNDEFFSIAHYGQPEIDLTNWQLEITGMVENPMTLTLDDLKSWQRQEVTYTLECSGNHGLPFLGGGIGNASWAGVPLAAILDEANIQDDGIEVIFYGTDAGEVTVRDQTFMQNFARSMSVEQAMSPYNLLAYEMNGEELPQANGFPLRLIAPGWYGVANVKWLSRIEVSNTRLMSHFMARDYVTIRQEEHNGEPFWTERSVTYARLKSAPARVVQGENGFRIEGAAWGAPIATVEVSIDGGEWQAAEIIPAPARHFTWKFWTLDWADADAGEHTVTTRATDTDGNVQPAPDDPMIANKFTYWEANGQITRRVEIPA